MWTAKNESSGKTVTRIGYKLLILLNNSERNKEVTMFVGVTWIHVKIF